MLSFDMCCNDLVWFWMIFRKIIYKPESKSKVPDPNPISQIQKPNHPHLLSMKEASNFRNTAMLTIDSDSVYCGSNGG